MAQSMFDNKPGYLLTNEEIETLFHLILVRVAQIDETIELIQHTEINEQLVDKNINLSMSNLTNLVRDNIDFIVRELNRLHIASKIRLTTNKEND